MTTREWATLFWLVITFLACMAIRDIRGPIGSVLKQMLQPKLFVAISLYSVLLGSLTWLAAQLGYWDSSLVGAVGFWFLFTGFKIFLQSTEAGSKGRFFRERIVELVGLAAFFELFLNVRTFSIPVEIALQPVLVFLILMQMVSKTKDEFKAASRLLGIVLAIAVVWLVVATVKNLVDHWGEVEAHDVIALYLVPIWLTIGALPYIYLLAFYSSYEQVFMRMRNIEGAPASWGAKLGVMVELRGNLRQIYDFSGTWPGRAALAESFGDARQVVKEFKENREVPS